MQTTMIMDENFRLKGFNIIVSEVEFLILSIALSRMADGKYVNDKDRAIAERMHNDLYEVGADMAGVPQTDLVKESDGLVKDLVEDYEPYKYEIKALHKDYQEPYCEIADTPQTDKVVCPNCGRSDYIRSFEKDFNIKNSEYRYKCINCNTYINDTPQTESTGSPIGDYRDGVGAWQTDCGWGKPTTVSHREDKED